MTHEYTTRGTCSRKILFEVEDGKVHNVQFISGCSGNTQGVAKLCEGMDVNEVIDRLEGIRCGMKPTSCPDQLAQALRPCAATANDLCLISIPIESCGRLIREGMAAHSVLRRRAHFRRCLASSLTKAFILFIFRFQSRYWEIQTTTKIAVKSPT